LDTGKTGRLDEADVVAALADPYARRILAACVRSSLAVKDISAVAELALPTAYRQVNRLVERGLLVVERSAITKDGKRYDLYRSRIRAARLELDASGERVSWELNAPVEDRLASMWDALRSEVRQR